ncbi:MAG: hypothetical protein U1D55_15920 [Phycisphaerae bacterium]
MRNRFLAILTVMIAVVPAMAGLASQFSGFTSINEIGVSGLQSSYHGDSKANRSVTGSTIAHSLAVFGTNRVSYPGGVGSVPSPGGAFGQQFDFGMLGVKVQGGQMTVRVASRIDPHAGVYSQAFQTWYGAGDMFLSLQDGSGVRQFALLSSWARDRNGNAINLGKGNFNASQQFHLSGGAGHSSLEGHLVALSRDNQVQITGGPGAYTTSNAPAGLDVRAFAKGGNDLGSASLSHGQVFDYGQNWYLQTWTFNLGRITHDSTFAVSLHTAASCGNDQIGMTVPVPAPAAFALGAVGLAMVGRLRRGA